MATSEYTKWLTLGRAHQGEGRPADAILCYRRALRGEPRASDPRFHLGEVLWQLGRFPDAIAAWREASRADPGHLVPAQALAEALLATGDAAGARDAAAGVLARMRDDARATMIHGTARMTLGDIATGPSPADDVAAALRREPLLLAVATLAGPLALALDQGVDLAGRDALLAVIARMDNALASAPPLLLALALEHMADESGVDAAKCRAALIGVARARAYAPADHDTLRRIALAIARAAPDATAEFSSCYAALCARALSAPVPLAWPRRTAGRRLRVIVLRVGASTEDAVYAAAAAIAALPADTFAITFATIDAAGNVAVVDAAAVALPPQTDGAAAKTMLAHDADVLIDLAGLGAATGPLLAQRPARTIWTLATLPMRNATPLVDRVVDDVGALQAALASLVAGHDPAGDCALDARSMAAVWAAAVHAHQQGDRVSALAHYDRVLLLQPDYAPAHYLAGNARLDTGDAAGARAAFSSAIMAAPGYIDARLAAIRAAIAAGDAVAAVSLCGDGLAITPDDTGLWRALGLAQLARRDGAAAAAAFEQALRGDPTDGETHYNLGVALQMRREFDEAARAYQRALAFRPGLAAAHFNLGVLFQEQGATDAAIASYVEVLATGEGNAGVYRNLGEVLLAAGRIDAYLANFRRFEAKYPNALPVAVQALVACQYLGDFAKLERYLEGLRHERYTASDDAELVDCLEELLYLLLFFDVPPAVEEQFARTYDAAARHVYGDPRPRLAARRPGRLRVGYLSADLRNHVMGKMVWAAVEHHDKARFELFFYSLSVTDDEWTAKFRGLAHHFDVIGQMSERAAATRIAADDLDVLVDLSTHTKGARPGILALKPARVQVTHVASAGAVGLSAIDFKLTDTFADIDENQAHQIETLLPMDGCVYPYRHVAAAVEHPFHRASLGIVADAIVLGAFVSAQKLSRRCLLLWRDVLARVPRSLLAFSPVDPALRGAYERLLAAVGIAADRALFLPQGRNDAENQARYHLVDFVLDPMPYGGVNGTLEALDMGVPVVTLVGRRHGERTSYSILANLGVTDTLAANGGEYVDVAARLATDAAFMADIRARIRAGLRRSALVDMPAHARALERAYVAALAAKAPEALTDTGERGDG